MQITKQHVHSSLLRILTRRTYSAVNFDLFSLTSSFLSAEERRYWELASARRMRRLRLLKGALMSIIGRSSIIPRSTPRVSRRVIIGSWASYTTVRYFIAYVIYSNRTRRSVALSLGISSALSLLVAGALALSLVVPNHTTHSRPNSGSLGKSLRHVCQFLASFFLFAPAAVNLALVFSWRNTGSEFSLRGRCHWNPDVVWEGVGGQCTRHAPVWGVWLAAAISRLVLTAVILVRVIPPEWSCILICEFCRSRIISPREPIACHDGSTIVRKMAREETTSLSLVWHTAIHLLALQRFFTHLSKRVESYQASLNGHSPAVEWQPYPS